MINNVSLYDIAKDIGAQHSYYVIFIISAKVKIPVELLFRFIVCDSFEGVRYIGDISTSWLIYV